MTLEAVTSIAEVVASVGVLIPLVFVGYQYRQHALTDPEALRVDTFLEEHMWAAYHVWDRTERGLFNHGRFEEAAGPIVASLLAAPHARSWWSDARAIYPPAFVTAVESVVAALGSGQALDEHGTV